jgi:sec-independent protein translocase protein TatA
MIGDILQPTHLLFVLVVALLVLGPKRLPEAGRALGKGLRDFRMAISGDEDHSSGLATETVPPPEAVAPPATAPPVETTPDPRDTAPGHSDTAAETTEPHPAETVHPVG